MERAFLVAQLIQNPPANTGDARDSGSFLGSGRSPGEGNDYPLQYSCLENSMDREAWGTTVHRVAESRTQLSMHAQCGKRNKLLKLGLFYGKKYFKKTNDPHHSSIDSRQKSSVISGLMNHHEGLRDSSCLSWISHCITGHEQTHKTPHSPALSMVSRLISFTLVTLYLLLNFGP